MTESPVWRRKGLTGFQSDCCPAALGSKGSAESRLLPLALLRSDKETNPTLLRDANVAG